MSDEPQGGMDWLLPWAENKLTQASVAALGRGLARWGGGRQKRPIDYRFAAGDAVLFKKYAAELGNSCRERVCASGVAFLATVSRFLATETAPSRVVRLDRAANRWPALSP
jgi:co-chaperonin GroES (HSP10)